MRALSLAQFVLVSLAALLVSHGVIAEADQNTFIAAAENIIAGAATIAAVIIRQRQQAISTHTALQLPAGTDPATMQRAIATTFAEYGFLGGLKKVLSSKPAEIAAEVVRTAVPQAAVEAIRQIASKEQTPLMVDEMTKLRRTQDRLRTVIAYLDQRVTRLEQLFQTSPQPPEKK